MNRLRKSYSTCMECGGKKMKSGGKWIQSAIKNPGSFTKQAQSAGMSVAGFKNKVLANKEDYSSTTVKRANLANTLSKMRKGQGGMDFKDPMGPDRMMGEMTPQMPKESLVDQNLMMDQLEPAERIQPLDPKMAQAKKMVSDLEKQAERDNVREYQRMLNRKYNAGLSEDGAWGKNTQAAYEKYVLAKKTTPAAKPGFTDGTEQNPVRMGEVKIVAKKPMAPERVLPVRPIPQKQPRLSDFITPTYVPPMGGRNFQDNTRLATPVRPITPTKKPVVNPKQTYLSQTPVGRVSLSYANSPLYKKK